MESEYEPYRSPSLGYRVRGVGRFICRPQSTVSAEFKAGQPGGWLLKPDTLSIAFPFFNRSGADFERVQITALTMEGGSLTTPRKLPLELGTIPAGHGGSVFAVFQGRTLTPQNTYPVKMSGTYLQQGEQRSFAVEGRLRILAPRSGTQKTDSATISPTAAGGGGESKESPTSQELDDEDMAPGIPLGNVHRPEAPGQPTELKPAPPAGVDPADLEIFRQCVIADSSGPIHGAGFLRQVVR